MESFSQQQKMKENDVTPSTADDEQMCILTL